MISQAYWEKKSSDPRFAREVLSAINGDWRSREFSHLEPNFKAIFQKVFEFWRQPCDEELRSLGLRMLGEFSQKQELAVLESFVDSEVIDSLVAETPASGRYSWQSFNTGPLPILLNLAKSFHNKGNSLGKKLIQEEELELLAEKFWNSLKFAANDDEFFLSKLVECFCCTKYASTVHDYVSQLLGLYLMNAFRGESLLNDSVTWRWVKELLFVLSPDGGSYFLPYATSWLLDYLLSRDGPGLAHEILKMRIRCENQPHQNYATKLLSLGLTPTMKNVIPDCLLSVSDEEFRSVFLKINMSHLIKEFTSVINGEALQSRELRYEKLFAIIKRLCTVFHSDIIQFDHKTPEYAASLEHYRALLSEAYDGVNSILPQKENHYTEILEDDLVDIELLTFRKLQQNVNECLTSIPWFTTKIPDKKIRICFLKSGVAPEGKGIKACFMTRSVLFLVPPPSMFKSRKVSFEKSIRILESMLNIGNSIPEIQSELVEWAQNVKCFLVSLVNKLHSPEPDDFIAGIQEFAALDDFSTGNTWLDSGLERLFRVSTFPVVNSVIMGKSANNWSENQILRIISKIIDLVLPTAAPQNMLFSSQCCSPLLAAAIKELVGLQSSTSHEISDTSSQSLLDIITGFNRWGLPSFDCKEILDVAFLKRMCNSQELSVAFNDLMGMKLPSNLTYNELRIASFCVASVSFLTEFGRRFWTCENPFSPSSWNLKNNILLLFLFDYFVMCLVCGSGSNPFQDVITLDLASSGVVDLIRVRNGTSPHSFDCAVAKMLHIKSRFKASRLKEATPRNWSNFNEICRLLISTADFQLTQLLNLKKPKFYSS